MNIDGKIIWITGASGGIGRAVAIAMSSYNTRLIISARRVKELAEVREICESRGSECLVCPLDLACEENIDKAVSLVLEKFGRVDILISNAGMSQRSMCYETDFQVYRRIMEVNFFGNIRLTQKLLPVMIEQGSGYLLSVGSIVSKFGFPLRSAYSASKHALIGYYETLYFELKPKNIKVSVVLPGRIKTDVSFNALTKDGTPYNKMDDGQASGMSAEQCVEKIIKCIKKEKKEMLIGRREVLIVYLKQFFPRIFNMIVNKIKST